VTYNQRTNVISLIAIVTALIAIAISAGAASASDSFERCLLRGEEIGSYSTSIADDMGKMTAIAKGGDAIAGLPRMSAICRKVYRDCDALDALLDAYVLKCGTVVDMASGSGTALALRKQGTEAIATTRSACETVDDMDQQVGALLETQ